MSTPAKKKAPWGMILGGCAVLMVLLMICGGGASWFVLKKASKFADESGVGDLIEAAKSAEEASGGAKGSKRGKAGKGGKAGAADEAGAVDAEEAARAQREAALEWTQVRAYIQQPLTKKDIDDYFKFKAKWEKDPAFRDWSAQTRKLKDLGEASNSRKKDSLADQLKTVSATAKWASDANRMVAAFDEFIRKEGGYEKYYSRQVRVGALIAAADTAAQHTEGAGDPDSAAVAKQMLKERPEIARQYQDSIKEAKAAQKKAKKAANPEEANVGALMMMASLLQSPGTVALARMPEQSFKTWAALSDKERKALRESTRSSDDEFGGWYIYFAANPSLLLMTMVTAEMEEFQQGK